MSEIPELKKPSQFWIYKSNLFRNDLIATSLPISFSDRTKVIHVIEYSAYEELQKQNKELIEAINIQQKSLKYYGNKNFDRVCFLDHATCEENYGADAREVANNVNIILEKHQKGEL